MNKLFKWGIVATVVLAVIGVIVIPRFAVSGSARDCDGNAVIYCGAYSTSELNQKITHGTGKQYQSGSQLTYLFNRYGYHTNDAGSLKNGYVYKNGNVTVNGRIVARNVRSMGRHKTAGSTQVSGVNYPLYLRHPSQSFVANSIPAYVFLNYDGSMRYAIIKSCGNIVPGVYRKAPPQFKLTVNKYEDLNINRVRDAGEPMLPGWSFRITGPNGYRRDVVTSANGGITVTHLNPGTYTVAERLQTGWESTTGLTQSVTITNANRGVIFGNTRRRPLLTRLQVVKYNDANANQTQDDGEDYLSGWQFRVSGPNGYTNTLVTDATGRAELTDLAEGTYTVTEVLQPNWINTTGLTVARNVTTDPSTQTFVFGNRQLEGGETPPGGGGESLPVSGPADAAIPIAGAMSMSGGILAWIRSKKQLLSALKK